MMNWKADPVSSKFENANLKKLEELNILTEFLDSVSEHAGKGICICHSTGESPFIRFSLWNQKMRELTGYTLEQMNSPGWHRRVCPDPIIQEKAKKRFACMCRGENLVDEECQIIQANGGVRNLFVSTSIHYSKDGGFHILAFVNDRIMPPGLVDTSHDNNTQHQIEQALTHRINFEELIYTISSNLVGVAGKKIDDEINHALALIGEFTDSDRAYVFEFRNGTHMLDNTYEWCAEKVKAQINNLQNIRIDSELPWFSRHILSGKVFNIPSVEALPIEAVRERQHFERQNIQSLIVVPMSSNSQLYGFLGFDDVRKSRIWTTDDQQLLSWAGNIFANAIVRKHQEKLLQESKEQLDLAIKGTNAGLWDWQIQTGEALFNDRWAEIIGFSLRELEPINIKTWTGHCHPEDLVVSNDALEKHFAGKTKNYFCECRMRHKNGSWIWVSDRGKVVEWDEDGKPLRMVGTHVDITEKKHYEAILQAERNIAAVWSRSGTFKERLSVCLKKIIQETSMDSGGFYRVNETDGSLVLESYEGLSEAFIDNVKYYPGDSLNARLVRDGNPVFALYEELLPHKKELISLEGLKATCIVPVQFRGKAVACLNLASHHLNNIEKFTQHMLIKISEYMGSFIFQEFLEEKNRQARQDLDMLFNTIEDMAFVFDIRGNILFCNASVYKKLGYPQGELDGKNIRNIHPSDRHPQVRSIMSKIMKREQHTYSIPLLAKNGQIIPAETLIEFGRWENYEVIYGISRDLTDRQKIEFHEKQMAKVNSLTLMAGSVAHHFNNTLGVVLGFLELALMDLPKEEEPAELVNEAFQGALKAAGMAKLMLTYVGQSNVKQELLDLKTTCYKIITALEKEIGDGIVIETDFPNSGPLIIGNETQVHQVLDNLIKNSADAFGEGKGVIRISVKTMSSDDVPKKCFPIDFHPKEDMYACVTVKDTGQGIAENHIENIFDPFFSTKFIGRGLGLSTVMGIMREHDGGVSVQSTNYTGTVVRLFFPIKKQDRIKEVE